MTTSEKPLTATASFYLALAGVAGAAHRKTRPAAALCLLLLGAGYAGLLHERLARADLRGYRHADWKQLDLVQVAAHLTAGYLGWRLLGSHREHS